MLRIIFFDAAGTLFHPRIPIGESYARVAARHGVSTTAAAIGQGFRRAFHESGGLAFGPGHSPDELWKLEYNWWREVVAKSFAGIGTFDDFDGYFAELFAYFADPDTWMADPGAAPLMENLKRADYRLGVVSNFDYRLYRILDGLNLSRFFDSVTISSEAGWAKPDPRIFKAALAAHGFAPAEAMHVGDSPDLDIVGADAANIAVVLIDPAAGSAVTMNGRAATVKSLGAVTDAARLLFPAQSYAIA
jgi:putative hydrolase of the HAD superfamily